MMHLEIVLDDCSKADLLNNYFASVGTIDNGIIPSVAHPSSCACTPQTVVFTEANVTAAICRLKNNLSSGPDELPPLLFRQTCYSLAKPLASRTLCFKKFGTLLVFAITFCDINHF